MIDYNELSQCIIDGDDDLAREIAEQLIEKGEDLIAAIEKGFVVGIKKVGELWEEGEYFLPELMQAAEAMKAAMSVINPVLDLNQKTVSSKGSVVLGTVEGDFHDIGKDLVATLLTANGFKVYDLGCDVTNEKFIEKAREVNADIIGASALLTTTMQSQAKLVEEINGSDLIKRPYVMIGGAPTSNDWAHKIGAHYSENALEAVSTAEKLMVG